MKVVGLTGGIGSGKSTVSTLLRERGAVVVDADAVVRELQEPGQPVFVAMVERFGAAIVAPDGTLDRPAVAALVFNDSAALTDLNALVHPAVGAEILRRIGDHAATDAVVIADIPLLAEGSAAIPMSGVVVVDVPVETQVQRLVGSRGMAEDDARSRIARQASRDERLARADRVVDNSGTVDELAAQIEDLWTWVGSLPDTSWPSA